MKLFIMQFFNIILVLYYIILQYYTEKLKHFFYVKKQTKIVREQTIPTKRQPLVDEVSANFCG
jgi:hypothetical protein